MMNSYKIFVENPVRKITLGKPSRGWERNMWMVHKCWRAWTVPVWIRRGTGGGVLWAHWWAL